MSIELESKKRVDALITAANSKTGGNASDLTSAVQSLVNGYGGDGGASGIYMAKVTPAEYLNILTITHDLGTTDILYVAAWAETLGDNTPTGGMTLCKMWAKTDIPTRRGGGGFSNGYGWSDNHNAADSTGPNVGGYERLTIVDNNTVKLERVSSGTATGYYAGITYTVFVIAANAEV